MSGETRSGSDEGRLSVVATPIGNLEDVTLRALRVLREADAILAEDTRRTRKLCAHHAIHTPLRALHSHSSERALARELAELAQGRHLALVSDAGTPLISDPGLQLVRRAAEAGVRIEVIPGPSAVTAALSIAGVPFAGFRFLGFGPRKGRRRRLWLDAITDSGDAVVFFEAPPRLAATLAELGPRLGEREVAVCRELTKLHEEVVRGTAAQLAERLPATLRGELTVVVSGRPRDT